MQEHKVVSSASSGVTKTVQHHVDFDGPNDPLNPLNWPSKKKYVFSLWKP